MSSITLTKSGSRWPTIGDSIAFITRGWMFEGPGPSSTRADGCNSGNEELAKGGLPFQRRLR